jgi:FMN-dependent NADH-azoreductase
MQDTTGKAPLKVLEIAASGRNDGSFSRRLSADLIAALEDRHGRIELTRRDLGRGLSFVDEAWINANFTPPEERNAEQRTALAESDALVAELKAADVLVIGTPVYNFGVPAALKAWVDMVARAQLTFRYTENGPKGLLEGKKAYVIVASGGVPVDSAVDFATPYLRHVLSFIGITDVDVIAADRLNSRQEESIDAARVRIAELIHTAPRLQGRVA